MLRTLTWQQLQELREYHNLEIRGDDRTDLRFAMLASVVAGSAGATTVDKKPYTADYFLKGLEDPDDPDAPATPAAPKQTVEEMERHLLSWFSGNNAICREGGQNVRR